MAQAQWQVLIDWNDDGDFSDPDEDVTAAVLGLTLEHFRDLAAGHIEAARLELELKNDDHKYSPPNGSSPLFGDLKPGRRVWVRAAYPYDALSDAAATRLADHIPTYDSGFSWEEHAGGYRIAPGGTGARTDGVRGSASKSTYGQRAKSIDARWTRELEVARTTIDNRLARRKDPRTVLAVTVPNGSKANLMLMLHRRFSDRVTVSYPDMGIDGDFFVEGHRIEVARGWTHVTRELLLQGV